VIMVIQEATGSTFGYDHVDTIVTMSMCERT